MPRLCGDSDGGDPRSDLGYPRRGGEPGERRGASAPKRAPRTETPYTVGIPYRVGASLWRVEVRHPDYGTVTFLGVAESWPTRAIPAASTPYRDLPAGVRLRMTRYAVEALDAVRPS